MSGGMSGDSTRIPLKGWVVVAVEAPLVLAGPAIATAGTFLGHHRRASLWAAAVSRECRLLMAGMISVWMIS